MIIDLNTRIWVNLDQLGSEVAVMRRRLANGDGTKLDASPSSHERAMSCVDGAVVRGLRCDRLGARIPNELVAEFVSKDPRRRIGVGGVDPMSPDVFDEMEAVIGLGLAGIEISPAAQGFHPQHTRAMCVYERCAELSMPVFVSLDEPVTRSAILDYARPAAWDDVARDLPDLPIVISRLGHPWVDETLVLAGKHERVYTDLSGIASRPWQLYNALLTASALGVMDKILFGSGYPNNVPARAIESIYTVNAFSKGTQLPSVARSSVRAIVEKDSLALLGIDAEITPRPRESDDAEPAPVVNVVTGAGQPASDAAGR